MLENIVATASRLSDDALLARIKTLALREREATVDLVAHLAELDGRRAHLGEGPGSLYKYCHEALGYSEDAAWNRAATANVVRRYPIVLDWLADGSLNVTTVRMLRPILSVENHAAVLTEARRRTKREVELIVRRFDPKPDVPSTIRRVESTVPAPSLPLEIDPGPTPGAPPSTPVPPAAPPKPTPPASIAPLTPERYRVQFTVSRETHDKLQRAQNLLCREIPSGDAAAIFDRALDVLLADLERKKLAATAKPRRSRGTREGSRDIPADVWRAVWARDGGQCAFQGRSSRCTERRFLEWHHVQPHGHQGPPTIENISLRCRAHNVYESELVFGRFDPSTVREARANYAVSREISSFRNDGASIPRR